MSALQLRRLLSVNRLCQSSTVFRAYHSYPEKGDVGTTTTTLSLKKKFGSKDGIKTSLDPKFRAEAIFPGIRSSNSDYRGKEVKTEYSKLANGLTVASQDMPGLMTSIVVLVKGGSSFEIQDGSASCNTGATQLLELTSFQSTTKRSAQEVSAKVEELGGMVQCISSRDCVVFCIDALRDRLDEAVALLAECLLQPAYLPEEIEEAKVVMSMVRSGLPAGQASKDAHHMAAYQGSPLGNHHYCPENLIGDRLNRQMIDNYRAENFFGKNIVISGAGVEHQTFVAAVSKHFSQMPVQGTPPRSVSFLPSVYTGGMYKNERELAEPYSHVAIGFEFCKGWQDDQIPAGFVVQSLLGGGSSFSAGGPGKGMYTRLYRQVLNGNGWAESVEGYAQAYDNTGTLTIDGSCDSDDLSLMIQAIVSQFIALAVAPITDEEFDRAKNMCKSMILMQLESRLVVAEDIARQVATYGMRKSVHDFCARIDKVTKEDMQALARRMLARKPSVSMVGPNLSRVPSFDIIETYIKESVEKCYKDLNIVV